jgi:hypothetical protein
VAQRRDRAGLHTGRLGFMERVSGLEECTPNMFLAVIEAILRVQVPPFKCSLQVTFHSKYTGH